LFHLYFTVTTHLFLFYFIICVTNSNNAPNSSAYIRLTDSVPISRPYCASLFLKCFQDINVLRYKRKNQRTYKTQSQT